MPPEEIEVVLVDLNTAGIQEPATLPGTGQGLAQRIVDYRAAHSRLKPGGADGGFRHRREEICGAVDYASPWETKIKERNLENFSSG